MIHNSVSVPIEKYPMSETRDNRTVSIGRLHEQKNQALLIDAFIEIAGSFTECTLENYGDGLLGRCYNRRLNSWD